MTEEERLRQALFDLKLKQYLYFMENRKSSDDLTREESKVKREYAKTLILKRGEHK